MTAESLLLREMISRSGPWNEALLQALNQRPDIGEYVLVCCLIVDFNELFIF